MVRHASGTHPGSWKFLHLPVQFFAANIATMIKLDWFERDAPSRMEASKGGCMVYSSTCCADRHRSKGQEARPIKRSSQDNASNGYLHIMKQKQPRISRITRMNV